MFQPLFSAADSYVGLAIIYGAMSLFWFVGVHGPSIVEPAISAALVANMSANLTAYQAGEQATHVLSLSSQYFVVCLGGTGATLVICFMFAFLAKSKEMKAIGRASMIPTLFNVNEPFLFGAPMVLNPIFFVPFVFAPICNIWALKIFVDLIGMDGFLYTLPWTVPGPVGIIMGLGFQPLAFVFLAAVLAIDFLVYYPFFKVYDREKCEEEAAMLEEELAAKAAAKGDAMTAAFQGKINASSVADDDSKTQAAAADSNDLAKLNGRRVLVLCQGGGTSGLLANALAKAAKEHGIDLETGADAYGNHVDMMKDFDLVILAPQAASYFDDLKADCDRMGLACCITRGKQYIDLTRDGEASLRFVAEQLNL